MSSFRKQIVTHRAQKMAQPKFEKTKLSEVNWNKMSKQLVINNLSEMRKTFVYFLLQQSEIIFYLNSHL